MHDLEAAKVPKRAAANDTKEPTSGKVGDFSLCGDGVVLQPSVSVKSGEHETNAKPESLNIDKPPLESKRDSKKQDEVEKPLESKVGKPMVDETGDDEVKVEKVEKAQRKVETAKVDVEKAKVEVEKAKVEVEKAKVEVKHSKVEEKKVENAQKKVANALEKVETAKVKVETAKVKVEKAKVEEKVAKAKVEEKVEKAKVKGKKVEKPMMDESDDEDEQVAKPKTVEGKKVEKKPEVKEEDDDKEETPFEKQKDVSLKVPKLLGKMKKVQFGGDKPFCLGFAEKDGNSNYYAKCALVNDKCPTEYNEMNCVIAPVQLSDVLHKAILTQL
jgi:hypothetical protein